jgi:hypothetical protein
MTDHPTAAEARRSAAAKFMSQLPGAAGPAEPSPADRIQAAADSGDYDIAAQLAALHGLEVPPPPDIDQGARGGAPAGQTIAEAIADAQRAGDFARAARIRSAAVFGGARPTDAIGA